jgi:DNA-binding CsgD family transcriptional regulator
MLTPLRLMPIRVDRSKYLPPLLLELIGAAERGGDLVPAVQAVVRKLDFDGFMYATASYHLRPNNDERIYVFTTLPTPWVMRYDQQAYVECDPRVLYSFESALPLVWDQVSERGKSARTDAFLLDAAAHGVGSGIAFPVYAGYPARTLVALNFAAPVIDEARRAHIAATLGDIVLFGQYFHELFVWGVIEKGIAPQFEGAPLSARERQCLQLAANGMTGAEIGFKLGIAERTVTFHFANLVSKLGVLNRHEAIAKSIAQGLIRIGAPQGANRKRNEDGSDAFLPGSTIAPPASSTASATRRSR